MFVRRFEDNKELLTDLQKEEQETEDPSWVMQDSIAGMANWILILLVVILTAFIIFGCYFYIRMNKQEKKMRARALVNELQIAQTGEFETPIDMEKKQQNRLDS